MLAVNKQNQSLTNMSTFLREIILKLLLHQVKVWVTCLHKIILPSSHLINSLNLAQFTSTNLVKYWKKNKKVRKWLFLLLTIHSVGEEEISILSFEWRTHIWHETERWNQFINWMPSSWAYHCLFWEVKWVPWSL